MTDVNPVMVATSIAACVGDDEKIKADHAHAVR